MVLASRWRRHKDPVQYSVSAKPWRPQPGPQTWLTQCPYRDLFYGGARFGGKTNGMLGDFLEHAIRWGAYAKGILFRRTYTELEEVIAISKSIYPAYGATYNENEHRWTFPWGAVLYLRFLRRDSDASIYQGWSVTWLGFDEAGNWPTSKAIDELWAILRSVYIPLEACVRRLSGNPGGPGQAWLMARYILDEDGNQRPPLVPFKLKPLPELAPDVVIDAVFIPSSLDDNLLADKKEYDRTLVAASHGNPALYRAWRWGDWTAFVGQAFHEWDQSVHVVPNRQPAKEEEVVGCLDWGYDQGAMYLGSQDADGRWEIMHEIYFRHIDARRAAYEFARRWERFGRHPIAIYADEQMWYVSGREVAQKTKIADKFRLGLLDFYRTEEECPVLIKAVHGPGSRLIKYNAMHEALAFERSPDGEVEPWNRPHLVFQARCKNAIRTIPALPEDPDNPGKDVDTDAEDHSYDSVCNLLMSGHRRGKRKVRKDRVNQHPGFQKRKRRKMHREDEGDELDEFERLLAEEGEASWSAEGYHMPGPNETVPYD